MFLLHHSASSLKASDFRAYEMNTVARPRLASPTTSGVRKEMFNRLLAFLLWVDGPTKRYFSIISSCYPRAFSRLETSRIEILSPLNRDTKDRSKTTTSSSSDWDGSRAQVLALSIQFWRPMDDTAGHSAPISLSSVGPRNSLWFNLMSCVSSLL